MDLQFDEQQELLRQSLDRLLDRRLPFEVRRSQRSGPEFCGFWKALDAELGMGAAGIAEDLGGFGGGTEAEMIVAAALGRSLVVAPYVSCHVLSASLLASLGEVELVRGIAQKQLLVTTAVEESQTRGDISRIETLARRSEGGWVLSGCKLAVDFAGQADFVLVPARTEEGDFVLFKLEGGVMQAERKVYALIDETPAGDLLFDGFQVPFEACIARGEKVLVSLQAAVDRACAALCAEAFGVASVMVADTVAYAKNREQFGVPIASFQVLQHRMVDMWAKVQEMEAATLLAALKVDQPAAISAAKATASDGLRLVGQGAVQLHGAMGLTEELRVGHYFKRATVLELRLGNAADHVERYRLECLAMHSD